MTNKEAIMELGYRNCVNCDYLNCNECNTSKVLFMAEKALEQADKYKWHDLRKNPDDLPTFHQVIVARYTPSTGGLFYSIEYFGEPYGVYPKPKGKVFYGSDSEYGDYVLDDVIAWKEIEPYESEVEK